MCDLSKMYIAQGGLLLVSVIFSGKLCWLANSQQWSKVKEVLQIVLKQFITQWL